jgi:hypothetical protein
VDAGGFGLLVMRWWNTGEICSSSCFGFDAVVVCKSLRVRVGWLEMVASVLQFVCVSDLVLQLGVGFLLFWMSLGFSEGGFQLVVYF